MKLNCKDELVQMLKKYGYNLVALPKENIKPLQLLLRKKSGLWAWVSNVFTTPVLEDTNAELRELFEADSQSMPQIKEGDVANELTGNRSSDMGVEAGAEVLLNLLGLPALEQTAATKLAIKEDLSSVSKVNFSFGNEVSRKFVSVLQLDSFLKDAQLRDTVGNTFQENLDKDQIYIVTDVLLSNSFTMQGIDSNKMASALSFPKIKALFSGKVSGKFDSQKETGLKYEGEKQLVFGFKAVRLFSNKEGDKYKFKIKSQDGMAVKNDENFPTAALETVDNFIEME